MNQRLFHICDKTEEFSILMKTAQPKQDIPAYSMKG